VIPGLMIALLMSVRSLFNAQNVERERFDFKIVWLRLREGIWALSLPAVILGGIYAGIFTPT
jgi:C4-dicarboxylate transporter DctM subunit